jgi:hypothetical protein
VPKRDRNGWRQPTAFDDDTSAPRVSCVLLRVTQPKEPVTDGVCPAWCLFQCVC